MPIIGASNENCALIVEWTMVKKVALLFLVAAALHLLGLWAWWNWRMEVAFILVPVFLAILLNTGVLSPGSKQNPLTLVALAALVATLSVLAAHYAVVFRVLAGGYNPILEPRTNINSPTVGDMFQMMDGIRATFLSVAVISFYTALLTWTPAKADTPGRELTTQ